jgi:N-acetylmuramoyl-L-alanine amidase
MHQARKSKQNQAIRRSVLVRSGQTMFALTMMILMIVAILLGLRIFGSNERPIIRIAQPTLRAAPTVSVIVDEPTKNQHELRVGIVAGHKGYDPGTVCDDGLTEADVNYVIALEVVDLLGRRGIQADLLDEYDTRLTDYQADALVSVHADSCNIPGATGFKVARVTNSAIPAAEDALVACLNQEYAIYTGLPQHPASITDNMTNYHAFNEIHPSTPGAIIETGFLLDDRYLLEQKPKIIARGIAAGILCFLEE